MSEPTELKKRARRAATETLRVTSCSVTIPIDPVAIAQQLGIVVKRGNFDQIDAECVSGGIFKDGDQVTILLNGDDSFERRRFTCAHEIGHYIKRMEEGRDDIEFTDYRDANAANGKDPEEIFANEFAAELLMPEEAVREASRRFNLKDVFDLIQMAREFEVSTQALRFRLQNLRLLPS